MKGAPGDSASKEEWIEYLTAAKNLNEKAVYYQNAKLQYMDKQGLRGMQGFNKQWEIDNPYERYEPLSPQGGGAGSALDQASEQELSEFEEWKRNRQTQGTQ
jgi:site-specific DNA-adenine methylase